MTDHIKPKKKKKKAKKKSHDSSHKPRKAREDMFMFPEAPWEEFSSTIPIMGGGVDEEVVTMLEVGSGKLKVTYPLQERDAFSFGSEKGSRTIVRQTNADDVLLDEEVKIEAMEQAYRFYREDPIFRALVIGYTNFIIGKGIVFRAEDEDPAVQEYIEEFWKVNEMDGKDAEIESRDKVIRQKEDVISVKESEIAEKNREIARQQRELD